MQQWRNPRCSLLPASLLSAFGALFMHTNVFPHYLNQFQVDLHYFSQNFNQHRYLLGIESCIDFCAGNGNFSQLLSLIDYVKQQFGITLHQWRCDFAPREHWAISVDIFGCYSWGGKSEWRETKDDAKYPIMPRIALYDKELSGSQI